MLKNINLRSFPGPAETNAKRPKIKIAGDMVVTKKQVNEPMGTQLECMPNHFSNSLYTFI